MAMQSVQLRPGVLRTWRENNGLNGKPLSQSELASILGVHTRTIIRAETRDRCSPDVFVWLLQHTGLSSQQLKKQTSQEAVHSRACTFPRAPGLPLIDPSDETIFEPVLGKWLSDSRRSLNDVLRQAMLQDSFYGQLESAVAGSIDIPDTVWVHIANSLAVPIDQLRKPVRAREIAINGRSEFLAQRLMDVFNLQAYVVGIPFTKDRNLILGHATDLYLRGIVSQNSNTVICLGGGSTMRKVAERLTVTRRGNCTLVAKEMPSRPNDDPDHPREVVRAANGRSPDSEAAELSSGEVEQARRADIILFGIGSLSANSRGMTFWENFLGPEEFRELQAKHGITGDIGYHLIGRNKTIAPRELGYITTGLGLENDLSKMGSSHRILVANGPEKASAVIDAIRRNVVDYLVCDSSLAMSMLDQDWNP